MVEYTIDIDFSPRRIDAGRKRIEAVQNFEIEDRVPVLLNVGPRYLLPKLGTGFRTFYDDPELHLYYQILSWQWTLENLEDDRLIEEELEVHPTSGRSSPPGSSMRSTSCGRMTSRHTSYLGWGKRATWLT